MLGGWGGGVLSDEGVSDGGRTWSKRRRRSLGSGLMQGVDEGSAWWSINGSVLGLMAPPHFLRTNVLVFFFLTEIMDWFHQNEVVPRWGFTLCLFHQNNFNSDSGKRSFSSSSSSAECLRAKYWKMLSMFYMFFFFFFVKAQMEETAQGSCGLLVWIKRAAGGGRK